MSTILRIWTPDAGTVSEHAMEGAPDRTGRFIRMMTYSLASSAALHDSDTKAGTLIATDRYGNKYYENMEEELPLRTRWVDYKEKEYDPSQIEPGWHAWLSYMVDAPPTQDKILQTGLRAWELPEHRPNLTLSRGAYKTYST
ncbi:hypothetical protein GB937_005730 [Aspergillus fischeri]|nr:hypothetical protein GB937_005730 [Aspergillus fischeri]